VKWPLYDGLTVLQHRGQDAAGIATMDGARLHRHKGTGLAKDVFDSDSMARLVGHIGIAHCRYPTAGSEGADEAQPFYVNSPYGIALAHNGNLINTDALRQELYAQDRRHINTGSDSEVLLNIFAHELAAAQAVRPQVEDVFAAIARVHERCAGGYAVASLVLGLGVVAFRDRARHPPAGARQARHPRGPGMRRSASEAVALDLLGFRRLNATCAGRRHRHHRGRRAACAALRRAGAARALHLRVRLFRAPGLDDRERLGVQGAAAHGREAGREDPAPASGPRHRSGDPDSRYLAHRALKLAQLLA
jgi:amidophosphoribosyltransferase